MPYEKLAAIRAARPDAELVVDANQGWSFRSVTGSAAEVCRSGPGHDRATTGPWR